MDVLKNKYYKEYTRLSRYAVFPCYYNTLDDKYLVGTSSALDKSTNYTMYQVKNNDSYDYIALKAYNNPTYYWIICDFNNIIDVFDKPVPGTYLKIPVLSNIVFSD